MLSITDILLHHLVYWLVLMGLIIFVSLLYLYPYLNKHKKKFNKYHMIILIVNVVSFYIFLKLLEDMVYNSSIIDFDHLVNQTVVSLQTQWLTNIMMFITAFGNAVFIIIFCLVFLGMLIFKKRWRYAILSTLAIIGSLLLQVIFKNLTHRARPPNSLIDVSNNFSFPSGHAITSIVIFSLLIYSFKDDIKDKLIKSFFIITASMFSLLIGLSRIYLNAHFFSDVIGGFALGLFWFTLILLVEKSINNTKL